MTQKQYYRLAIAGEYEDVIKTIQEKKPELRSASKVTEFALQLLEMQIKGEIIRFTQADINKFKTEMLPVIEGLPDSYAGEAKKKLGLKLDSETNMAVAEGKAEYGLKKKK